MPTFTTNYDWIKPSVGDPTDQDLWGGMLNSNLDSQDTIVKSVSDNATNAITRATLPIGSLYFNATDGTNPGTLLGYGTWSAFGQGRVIIGVGTGTDINGVQLTTVAGDTGGEYRHTQTIAEMAAHAHSSTTRNGSGNESGNTSSAQGAVGSGIGTTISNPSTGSQGGGNAFNVTQPYISVYIWIRTA